MPAALPVIALVSFACTLIAGWLIGKTYFSNLARAAGRRAARQQESLEKQRRQYRRRTQVLRKVTHRLRREREDMQAALAKAESGLAAEQGRLHDLTVQLAVSNAQLDETLQRMSSTEQTTGLLRIERDELMARTQRLRSLSHVPAVTQPGAAASPAADEARAEAGTLREFIAERDGRIHELECKLREAENRATELDITLRNWKHRVAPLVLQLRIQRERNRKLRALIHAEDRPTTTNTPAMATPACGDDLKRIRGIGPSIERKLRAHGIHEYRQLAELGADDLASIAARLSLPATRPARDGWIEQARALYAAKKQPPATTFG